ncbi:hemerythrin domain-containing protein [Evansella sp. AB-rgal1]|uniref:hemerythrin domain-containing protein n=1 Tax=Evansella sp. AB-rgal1 TaxID=3242696 RepID=UPI00359EECDB
MTQHACFGNLGDINDIDFCVPLQQLYDEHPSLLAKMGDFYSMVQQLETNKENTDWSEAIASLNDKLEIFVAELEPHSDREEDILFEMMVKYIGREGGPIQVMEYEHNTAKQNIKLFFEKVTDITVNHNQVSQEKAFELFNHIKIIYTTLTDHFMKEEQILFPMAEKMLSDAEKEELALQFKTFK